MEYKDPPLNVQKVCAALIDGLTHIFGEKLYWILHCITEIFINIRDPLVFNKRTFTLFDTK